MMLNEGHQAEKTTYYMIPFLGNSGKGKAIGTESRSVIVRVWDKVGLEEGID